MPKKQRQLRLCKIDPDHGRAIVLGYCRKCADRLIYRAARYSKRTAKCAMPGCTSRTYLRMSPYCADCREQAMREESRWDGGQYAPPREEAPYVYKIGEMVLIAEKYPTEKYRGCYGHVTDLRLDEDVIWITLDGNAADAEKNTKNYAGLRLRVPTAYALPVADPNEKDEVDDDDGGDWRVNEGPDHRAESDAAE